MVASGTQLAGLDVRQRRGRRREVRGDAVAEQVLQGRRAALVRNVHRVGAGAMANSSPARCEAEPVPVEA